MNDLIVVAAQYLLFIIGAIAGIYWLRLDRSSKQFLATLAAVGGLIDLMLVKIAGALYYDPRPFVVHHTSPLLQHAADNGFPSDHTALAALIAFIVYYQSRKLGLILIVLTLLLGISRVAASVHSPRDIAASLVIGAMAVVLAIPVARRILNDTISHA